MKSEWRVTIPNPLAIALYRIRYWLAVRKWNRDIPWIQAHVLPGDGYDPGSLFSWSQLVWQEIWMWCKIGYVTKLDFEWMCERRGFNATQRAYLEHMLNHLWLRPQRKRSPRPPRWWEFRRRRRWPTVEAADRTPCQADTVCEVLAQFGGANDTLHETGNAIP